MDRIDRALRRSQWTNWLLAGAIVGASVLSGSRALLAEALHNALDGVSDRLSRSAHRVAGEPADARFTKGRGKAIGLASLGSAATMMVTSLAVVVEAVLGFVHPVVVKTLLMGVAPVVAVAANLFIALGFGRGHGPDEAPQQGECGGDVESHPHAHGSFLHAIADIKSSLAVIAAATVIRLTGWPWVDAAAALLIAWNSGIRPAWRLLRRSVANLLDASPVDAGVVERAILRAPNVERVGRLEVTDPNWDEQVRVRAVVQVADGQDLDPGQAKRLIDPFVDEALREHGMSLAPSSEYVPVRHEPGPLYHADPRRMVSSHDHHGHDEHPRTTARLSLKGLRSTFAGPATRRTAGRHRRPAVEASASEVWP